MKNYTLFPLSLALILSACSNANTAKLPVPAPPIGAANLDATVDLNHGYDNSPTWTTGGETFSLITPNGSGTSSNLLTRTTLGADGHARLTLPTDAQIAPFLQTSTAADAQTVPPSCTQTNFTASPASFRTISAEPVLNTALSSTGFLRLADLTPVIGSSNRTQTSFRGLVYVDQPVSQDYTVDCTSPDRTDHTVTSIDLPKGWSVLKYSAVQSGSQPVPMYTTTIESETAAVSTVNLNLSGISETGAPRP